METPRYRRMVFTINNPTLEQEDAVKNCICKAISAGLEIGEEQKTPHIQGAVVWKNPKTYEAAQQALGGPCYTRAMAKPWAANVAYTQKENLVIRFVELEQGNRTDIMELKNALKRNASDAELLEDHEECVAKYPRFVDYCRNVYGKERSREWRNVTVKVLWGAAGSGKTREAVAAGAYAVASFHPEWWDGYSGETVVLFDDFYGQITHDRILRLWDGYPIMVPVKGGFRYLMAETIYVTSNDPPDMWYPYLEDTKTAAMMRRISEVRHIVAASPGPCGPWLAGGRGAFAALRDRCGGA